MRLGFYGIGPAFRGMRGNKFSQKLSNWRRIGVGKDSGISCGHGKIRLEAASN
jgi:hypothetical protein